ncbi:MAG TPA: hypothetical protein HA277_03365 [Methanosphaera sp.]|nr:hypothetical protein [Methanosphaera sp.]HIJ15421.1 hypothetical protein [Methanosphaera sp.]
MKDIKEKLEEYYRNLNTLLDSDDDSPKLLHRKNTTSQQNTELLTGIIVLFLIVSILLSLAYYFLIFAPQQEQLSDLKQEKINRVNVLLADGDDHNREFIISQINNCSDIKRLEQMDVDAMIYPFLKSMLLEQLDEYKDNYGRVEITSENMTDIMKTDNARNYINSRDSLTLSTISVRPVESVIIPLSINRKQAASGLITEGNIVDIYTTNNILLQRQDDDGDNISQYSHYNSSSRIAGGCRIVSILRSKDSAVIDQNMELSEYPRNRNLSQSSLLDLEEILSSRAAGVYDDKQIRILWDDYATRLSNYERKSKIGELDVWYIIMLEVPSDSVEYIINNMDNIILTIPTYDAPSWVRL